jgi:hypothetical protein
VNTVHRTLPLLILMLSACSPKQATYTVEDYLGSDELRKAQVARCQSDPGTLQSTPDCVNAERASALEDRVRLRDLPPIGLDTSRETPAKAASQSGPPNDQR